jgi:hypothetical protein
LATEIRGKVTYVWARADQGLGVGTGRTWVPDAGHTFGFIAFLRTVATVICCLQTGCSSQSPVRAEVDDGSLRAEAASDSSSEAGDTGSEAGQVGSPCNPGPQGMLAAPICVAGLVCCVDQTAMAALCQTGPCPYVPSLGMPGQLCLTDADCFARGDVCGPPAARPGPVIAYCHPPSNPDGGSDSGADGTVSAAEAGQTADD